MSGDGALQPNEEPTLTVSVVVPVYRGEGTLAPLLAELESLTTLQTTPAGRRFRIHEVLLVWDRGTKASAAAMRELAAQYPWVRPVWLSRNFGQHAATLAGITSSGGDWIVTMDEDGQQDPAFIAAMLDTAYERRAQLVYAKPTNPPPHGALRNAGSRIAKWLFVRFLVGSEFGAFNSYRLVLGEVGRSVAAYTGPEVYLDVAMSWVVAEVAICPVIGRDEGRAAGAYSYRRLAAHFGRLIVSSGTRPLLFVSALGVAFVIFAALVSIWVLYQRLVGEVPISGWASLLIGLLTVGGAMLLSLGIIAQYVGVATNMSMGKPVYVVVRDPATVFEPPAS